MKIKKHILLSFTVYFILFLLLLPRFQYVINTDAISYFSIARKYFNGHFAEAINGYFGPLYSWLILPAFTLKIEPVIFGRLINIVFSFMLFVLISRFSSLLNMNSKTSVITIYFFIIPALLFSFWYITPDYLMLILSMIFVLLALNDDYLFNLRTVLLSAIVAAMMFYTKSFGLAFFIIFQSVILMILIRGNKEKRKTLILNYFLTLAIFTILISPWIYLLSNKYGEFTISTSGKINLLIVNPELNFHHPSIESGIVPPSDRFAVSAWDDPDVKFYPEWSPFNSISDMKFFTINFYKNLAKFIAFLLIFCPLFVMSLFFLNKKILKEKKFLIISLTILLNGTLYSFIYVESRYIWLSLVLFSVLSFYILQEFLSKINFKRLTGIITFLFIILTTVPFVYFAFNDKVIDNRGFEYAKRISKFHNLQGNIATTNYWWLGLNIAYFLDSRFYGEEKGAKLDENLVKKFRKNGVNFIFDYSDKIIPLDNVRFIAKIDSLNIYEILNH